MEAKPEPNQLHPIRIDTKQRFNIIINIPIPLSRFVAQRNTTRQCSRVNSRFKGVLNEELYAKPEQRGQEKRSFLFFCIMYHDKPSHSKAQIFLPRHRLESNSIVLWFAVLCKGIVEP